MAEDTENPSQLKLLIKKKYGLINTYTFHYATFCLKELSTRLTTLFVYIHHNMPLNFTARVLGILTFHTKTNTNDVFINVGNLGSFIVLILCAGTIRCLT